MSNRVLGIMILVGAGLALPNQASDPEKGAASSAPTIQAQQAAPLRFRYHTLKSHFVEELETDKPIVVTEKETGTGQVSS